VIAKHVPMRSVRKSDFADLVKYITDEQMKNERVGYVSVTNCQSTQPDIAVLEILNVQALNKRSASDKTYHLIISFREGEQISEANLAQIEARICDGLGYGEHQRVSVVHHDTDNLHMHIAINKIHPTRYTIHTPYYDHKILGSLCEKLESEFELAKDNHKVQKRGAENRAADMENHAGVESLIGWIKRECFSDIQSAKSWSELHDVMRSNGLELHLRGNGLAITCEEGTTIKASSLGRDYSKKNLETKFGAFQLPAGQDAPPKQSYSKKPMRSGINTVELFAKYQSAQNQNTNLRTVEWKRARDSKNRQIESVKRKSRLKRSATKLMTGGLGRRALYSVISKSVRSEIQAINKQYLEDRQQIYNKYQRKTWADWLHTKAIDGDAEALAVLRARSKRTSKGNVVSGELQNKPIERLLKPDSITKSGTIIYRAGTTAVRDDGDKLSVSRGSSGEGLVTVLNMAVARYGERITVNGSAAFKEQIALAAVISNLSITFDDPDLERRRQVLLQSTIKKDLTNEQAKSVRGRNDSRGVGSVGHTATGFKHSAAGVTGRPGEPRNGLLGKPNVGRVGRKPPPQSKNRLRRLSELGLVRLASGSEVLLSGHVSDHMEQQRTQSADSVRRGLSGAGLIGTGTDAANKYIQERETARLKIFDIPKHTLYNPENSGIVAFAGIRRVEGQPLALLKCGDEIMVLPIDESAVRRLKRVAVGEDVTVTLKGGIKTKGRSR
jgi:hypothetical protein